MRKNMKPLVTNQLVLKWLYVFVVIKEESIWKRLAYIALSSFVIIMNITGVTLSGFVIWMNVSTDLIASLFALLQVCAFMLSIYVAIIGYFMQSKTTATFTRLSEIYDENKDEESFQYLAEANNKSEWMWGIYFKYIMGGILVSNIVVSMVSVVICFIIKGHYDSANLYRIFIFDLPWNQSAPIGYIAETCFTIVAGASHLIIVWTILLLFISICLHHEAFHKMFCLSIGKLDDCNKKGNAAESLCKSIRFHVSVKDWFWDTARVYSPLIAVKLILFAMLLACVVFQFDLVFRHIDFTICILISSFSSGALTLFLYCYFGKLTTDSFAGMNKCLYNANWYDLHVGLQKYFILMIANTQQPIRYDGFGIAILNLETFTQLVRLIGSYYMMFRTITLGH